jgi:hypothetical protein
MDKGRSPTFRYIMSRSTKNKVKEPVAYAYNPKEKYEQAL